MRIITILALLLFLAVTSTVFAADSKASKSARSTTQGEDLFAAPKIFRLKLEIAAEALESLRKDPKRYVKASLKEGEHTYVDVGVRVKGSAPFEGLEKKPSLAFKFNEFVKDQEFHGRGRILLSNAHKDPTFLCEAIGGEIFRSAGVPASKVAYAVIEAGGKDLGLYVVSEAANKDFLSQHFKKAKGNLYEGSSNDITDKLEKDGGDSSTDQADLKALAAALKESDLAERARRVGPLLDMERFAAFAAVEVLAGHHDGYTMDKNNYRIYNDPASGQMVFLPHGLDQLFAKSDEPLIPEWKGLVAKAVLTSPTGQRLYLEKMSALLAGGGKAENILRQISELSAMIRPVIAERDAVAAKAFDDAVAKLRTNVSARTSFLEQQLKSQAASK
ncbi:MAG: CotH kinase family protein [Verrucomicrobia bacterium]|nr:CotH kinase family protein [Verrucomicrobiota bacterium]